MATPTPIEIDIDGKTYTGVYSVDGNMLTTRYQSQAMTHEIGGTAPAIAARSMLQRLVRLVHDLNEDAGPGAS